MKRAEPNGTLKGHNMSKPTIGFIGLGLMGGAMVGRLQDLGYNVTVLGNRDRTYLDAAVSRGAVEAASAKEVAQASDIVMLCMGTSDHVESRMRGADGVIAGLRKGATVVDFGTSLPGSSRSLADEVQAAGGSFLDAPLGRTPAHAKDGLLNIMASGDKAAFDAVEPVLKDLGENVFHLGPVGSGHTIKLINNFFGMTVANAMAEAFAMADVAGVDRAQLYDVMAAGPLHSGMMDFVKAYGVEKDPTMLAFAIKNAAKDVGYYARMAEDAGVDSIMSKGPLTALNEARDSGQGDEMVSQMVDFFAKRFKG
ncbi:NAD(P)-dependent oxidoreductase [Sulfitobacter geojensis]|uniref:NAD(P)-dependent oxidoreductase n=1 Tax=Sulfitobacter geojensis TaxID=1342299 RepID=UPI0009DE9F61|nr:NAD(P)-dependent oxidoreductase [Sulfitobacter geojensis]